MNLLTTSEIAKKLEKWADQKIPELMPGPKLAVMVSLNRLVGYHLDELMTRWRVDGARECAKIAKENYEKLKEAAKRADLNLVKRIVEFKFDRLNKQHNEVSASDILNPCFKMPTNKPWKDSEIPRKVYFDECAQCARQLARALLQVAVKAEPIDAPSPKPPVSYKRWRIGTWLWKLYEKTVKAFFDSLLGK